MFRKMPVLLIMLITLMLWLSPHLSLSLKQEIYAFSLSIKAVIVFLLPLIIFSLLFKTAVHLAHRATAVIAGLLILVCCSNFFSTFLSHFVGEWIYHFNLSLILPSENQGLTPAWNFALPQLLANNKAMFSGLGFGIALGFLQKDLAKRLAHIFDQTAGQLLKCFTWLVPLFVMGFVVKLQYDGVVQTILKDYALIFGIIALAQFGYIISAYWILNRFSLARAALALRQILPASIAGFSTMSSAAVMPLTILGAKSNAKNKDFAASVVPATVNIHLVGDCFAIPIFAYAVMKSFGIADPALGSYLIFVCYFVLAKFSVAAIPGGGIIVMLPILEAYLGFTPEMLSLMTALYILFDPVITSANVLGNGAFALLADKLFSLSWGAQVKENADSLAELSA